MIEISTFIIVHGQNIYGSTTIAAEPTHKKIKFLFFLEYSDFSLDTSVYDHSLPNIVK